MQLDEAVGGDDRLVVFARSGSAHRRTSAAPWSPTPNRDAGGRPRRSLSPPGCSAPRPSDPWRCCRGRRPAFRHRRPSWRRRRPRARSSARRRQPVPTGARNVIARSSGTSRRIYARGRMPAQDAVGNLVPVTRWPAAAASRSPNRQASAAVAAKLVKAHASSSANSAASSRRLSAWPERTPAKMPDDRPAGEIKIAHRVEHLVAHELVGVAQPAAVQHAGRR